MEHDTSRQAGAGAARLLFLYDSLVVRGGGEAVLRHVAGLAGRVAAVDLALVWRRARAFDPAELDVFGSITDLDWPTWVRASTWPASGRAWARLRAIVRRHPPRACLAFSFPAALRAAVGRVGSPLVWVCQDDVRVLIGPRARRRLALDLVRRAVTEVVCLNPDAVAAFARLGFAPPQLRLLRIGVPVARFAACALDSAARVAWRQRHGIPDGDIVVVCVAHLNPTKNHALLLEAVRVARDHGTRVVLVCVGGVLPGAERRGTKLRALADTLGVAPQIVWADRQADVRPWLAMADAAVLASRGEAGPLALYEAGAMGLPLVGSDVAGIRDVVVPGETGLRFGPGDAAGCAAALVRLAGDPALRARLGRGAAAHVRAGYDRAVWDDAWRTFLTQLLGHRGGA